MKPALAFYRAQKDTLTDDERILVARTLNTMALSALGVSRLEEARALTDECLALTPLESPLTERSPVARAYAVSCGVNEVDLSLLSGDAAAAAGWLAKLRHLVERFQHDAPNERRWISARALVFDRTIREAQNSDAVGDVPRLMAETLRLDEAALALKPDDPAQVVRTVLSSAQYSLALFSPQHPDESLEISRKGLELIRRVPRRYQNKTVLRAWGSLLQHLVTTLIWAGRRDEAKQYIDEGTRVFEQLGALEPKDVQGRGLHADLLLALDKPCEALKILDQIHQDGVRGDYLTSQLLAALACGDDTPFTDGVSDLAQSKDAQMHWMWALWLVKAGRTPEAVAELREWKAAAGATSVQWPLGVLDGLPARMPPAQREAIRAFVAEMEAFLRDDDAPSSLPIFERLLGALGGDVPR
jgi:tetratricopeptide (TPR) repeat protein